MRATSSRHHDDNPRQLQPGQVVERYVVDGLIGSGGTATVYRVHHADLGTVYALKVLNLLSPGIRRRTLQEGRLQARLSHRNIVAVYDTFEVDGAPALLLEMVEGPALDVALQRVKLSLDQAEDLFRGICEGVAKAHAFGLVHRDLKPANVLLAQASSRVVPKVTDFGIAKVTETDDVGQTRAGVAMGTPQYMAPEQIRDARSVDRRADVFSLGCILYELVTHRRAFPDEDIVRVYNAVCEGNWTDPTTFVPDLPPRIVNAIRGALEVDRERRIPDCTTLLDVFDGRRTWKGDATGVTAVPTSLPAVDGPANVEQTYLPGDLLAPLDDATAEVTAARAHASGMPQITLADDATEEARPRPEPSGLRWPYVVATLATLGIAVGLALAPAPPAAAPAAPAPVPVVEPAPPPPSTAAAATSAPVVPPPAAPIKAPEPAKPAPAAQVVAPDVPRVVMPPPEPAPALPAAPPPAAPERVASPKPAPAPTTGLLRVLSQPPTAQVSVDGKDVGLTPQKLDLDPGHHLIRVRLGDQVDSFLVDIEGGGDERWCYVFAERKAVRGSCPR